MTGRGRWGVAPGQVSGAELDQCDLGLLGVAAAGGGEPPGDPQGRHLAHVAGSEQLVLHRRGAGLSGVVEVDEADRRGALQPAVDHGGTG
jgi:hypothetical protein